MLVVVPVIAAALLPSSSVLSTSSARRSTAAARRWTVITANENPFGSFLDAAKAAAASASEAAKAAADSLAPIDDEYNSSPERQARLTEQQRIAEAKRAERQDLNAAAPAAARPKKNPLEKFVEAFTPIEVDRDGNPVPQAPPPVVDDRDAGEKLFGFFFGEQDQGVVSGIARTAGAPDTYPATKTEFADPVAADTAEMALLRPLLKNTNLEYLDLKCVYDAQRDGWTADAFHAGTNYVHHLRSGV